jgi:hypothetical protein
MMLVIPFGLKGVSSYNGARDILGGAFTLLQEQPLLLPRLGYLWNNMLMSTVSSTILFSFEGLIHGTDNSIYHRDIHALLAKRLRGHYTSR